MQTNLSENRLFKRMLESLLECIKHRCIIIMHIERGEVCNSRAAKRPLSLLEGPSSSLLCYVSWLSCGNKLVLMMENVSRASWCWLLQRLTKPEACFQLFIPDFFYHSLFF